MSKEKIKKARNQEKEKRIESNFYDIIWIFVFLRFDACKKINFLSAENWSISHTKPRSLSHTPILTLW